jgi:tripartite-type tricarboxylate transporter receptor subunit TctC
MVFLTQRRRACLALCIAGAALAAITGPALAQDAWKPTKPIRIIVPFAPGGGGDVAARLVAPPLGNQLGQTIVVENKAGASGSIASDYVYRAAPDGYTLLVATADSQIMYPQIAKVSFDTTKYVPIGGITTIGYVLMGRPDLPATLPELLALMKTQKLSYASGGAGSALHVLTEMFAGATKTELLHVPFQGAGPGLQALLGGQVDLMMVPMATAGQYRGKLRAYGISSAQRHDAMKDVPTLSEQGVAVAGDSWISLVAPPGTPLPVVESVSRALHEAVNTPEMQKKWTEMGMTAIGSSREEFGKFYLAEYRKWGNVIRAANIRVD